MLPATVLKMVGVVLLVVSVFYGVGVLASHARLKAETSRKAVHIAVGLIAAALAWVFEESGPVFILSAGGMLLAAAVRQNIRLRHTIGSTLHSVDRKSFGDCCLPIAVPVLHWLAMPDRVSYVVSILVLALADAAAALVGQRYGTRTFRTDEGTKSLEGSAALALVCAAVVFAALWLNGTEWVRAGAQAILIANLIMLAEAISWRGLDNLVLPLGTFALLKTYEPLSNETVYARVAVSIGIVALACLWHRRAGLIGSAGIAVAFVIYTCWAIGGAYWAVPPLVIFISMPYLGARHAESRADDIGVGPVLGMSAVPLAWMFLDSARIIDSALLGFGTAWSSVIGVVWVVRRRRDILLGECDPRLMLKIFAILTISGAACCYDSGYVYLVGLAAAALLISFAIGVVGEYVLDCRRRFCTPELIWTARALIVLVSSAVGAGALHAVGGW